MKLPTAPGWWWWAPSPDSRERFPIYVGQYMGGDPPEEWFPMLPGPDPDSRDRPLTLRYICWTKNITMTARTVASMGGVWLGPCKRPETPIAPSKSVARRLAIQTAPDPLDDELAEALKEWAREWIELYDANPPRPVMRIARRRFDAAERSLAEAAERWLKAREGKEKPK